MCTLRLFPFCASSSFAWDDLEVCIDSFNWIRRNPDMCKRACKGEYERRGEPTKKTLWGLHEQHIYMCYQNSHKKSSDVIGARARDLPSKKGDDDPADLPKHMLEWYEKTLKSSQKRGRSRSRRRRGSSSSDRAKKSKKKVKDGKRRKSSSSGSSMRSDLKAREKRSKTKKRQAKSKSDSQEDYPKAGYALKKQKVKGKTAIQLCHKGMDVTVELDPEVTWEMEENDDGVDVVFDVNNKKSTIEECREIFSQQAAERDAMVNTHPEPPKGANHAQIQPLLFKIIIVSRGIDEVTMQCLQLFFFHSFISCRRTATAG